LGDDSKSKVQPAKRTVAPAGCHLAGVGIHLHAVEAKELFVFFLSDLLEVALGGEAVVLEETDLVFGGAGHYII
jgi:hypothetical protein